MNAARRQVWETVRDALAAAPALDGIPVYRDNLSAASRNGQQSALRNPGVCLAVSPILEESLTGPATRDASHVPVLAKVSVHVRQNPDASDLDHDDLVDAVASALLAASAGLGRRGLQPHDPFTVLIEEDAGCLTTAIFVQLPLLRSALTPAPSAP